MMKNSRFKFFLLSTAALMTIFLVACSSGENGEETTSVEASNEDDVAENESSSKTKELISYKDFEPVSTNQGEPTG